MGSPPHGTVTFLFTDVEGSTRLWEESPDEMRSALAAHDRVLRSLIEEHDGHVFSTAGDAFAAAFWTPAEAVDAAVEGQRCLAGEGWPEPLVLRVRMGIHTGTADERGGDYFGPAVNRAARIMAAGHGGQILLSDVTARLVQRTDVRDLGECRLPGLSLPERIWQVGNSSFPPLRLSSPRVGNLPTTTRSLIGRVDDQKRLAEMVGAGRLVTLVGVGGVGKTRLALELGQSLRTDFPGGVWWCDLTPLDDSGGLAVAVAAMLGISMQPDMTPTGAIVDAMKDRQALVVVDNCEHVLDAAATLITAVIEECPTVGILATSREPLGVAAERVWPLRTLDPDLEGIELFLDRAAAADASFASPEDRRVLGDLCRHLDGIPLAIELAAARVRAMTPAELLGRLDDRFRLLRLGTRGGLDRHRTLGATLDWSYSLLDPREKVLLDRLAVFAGSFDLTGVEAVCTDSTVDRFDVLDLLSSLVDKSMVVAERGKAATRYRLLETVRHYSEAHAVERRELEWLRNRHLDHYLVVSEAAFGGWLKDYTSGRVVLDGEWDNVRAAVQHAQEGRDTTRLERLFAALSWPASYALSYEVGDWASQATELPGAGPFTFGTAATMAAMTGRFDEGERLAEEGIAAASTPLAPETWMCWTALMQGRARAGPTTSAYQAVVAAHRTATAALGDWGDAFFSAILAFWDVRTRPAVAAERAERAHGLAASMNNPLLSVDVLHLVGLYHGLSGDPSRGIAYCRQALAIADSYRLPRSRDGARNTLAQVALMAGSGDPTPAVRDAVVGASTERLWFDLWPTVRALARWWASHGQLQAAAVVLGHLDAHGLAANQSTLANVRSQPNAAEFLAQGARLNRDQFIAYILDHLPAEQ